MLIKEYRIALPMSVDEYRIAQLYMIQKKSREESHGAGSGVEILINKPYVEGPGGTGQYTYKIYHIGSHLPGWFRAILPKSALRVEEEAWNAYPYTKTRYRCPFVEKFSLEIETKYLNDGGEQENVFNLTQAEQGQRIVDFIDIVKDSVSSSEYRKEEDPVLYKSSKTSRGPLSENWREEYSAACNSNNLNGQAIMTAYKLCKVEFKYWGMQTKIEKFIHDIGLRKTMLRAHCQAWCWQDEWYGLELSDIRRLEKETQAALAEKMANANEENEDIDGKTAGMISSSSTEVAASSVPTNSKSMKHTQGAVKMSPQLSRDLNKAPDHATNLETMKNSRSFGSKLSVSGSKRNLADWRLESLEQLQESSSDEEFFDAEEDADMRSLCEQRPRLMHSTSMELVSPDVFQDAMLAPEDKNKNFNGTSFEKKLERYSQSDSILPSSPLPTPLSASACKTNILFMVLYGGSVLEVSQEYTSIRADYATFKNTFETVIKSQYPSAFGRIAFRLVPCPQCCCDPLNILSSLSPYSFDAQSVKDSETNLALTQEFIPLGAIALFATASADFHEHMSAAITKANLVYQEFLRSDEGRGFNGQVCFLADSSGSLLAYDALCQSTPQVSHSSRQGSHSSLNSPEVVEGLSSASSKIRKQSGDDNVNHSNHEWSQPEGGASASPQSDTEFDLKLQESQRQTSVHLNVLQTDQVFRKTSSGSHYESSYAKFDFDVSDFFMFGSPLGLVLSFRRMFTDKLSPLLRPACHQIYNLFHSHDPSAIRLEPLVYDTFRHISPIKLPRYSKFPLGDGESVHVVESVQSNIKMFTDERRRSASPGYPMLQRQTSCSSISSQVSGAGDTSVASITQVLSKWWGNKRLDYVLYCPEVLHSFPTNALPQLFHSSFWESYDVVAFILRQVLRQDLASLASVDQEPGMMDAGNTFTSNQPKEKWLKRRTTIKVRNLQPNHRANDVIVLEDAPQTFSAKFMYGPLDMTSLSGEKVDIHIMTQVSSGEWNCFGYALTDSHGKLVYTISEDKRLSQGMYPVKLVIRGDHTSVDFFLTVVPPKTETVVFSIDGSFTASMSIMGKDPKVRAGAVDVVRHWQELGYLILYVTARPDMQHKKVVAWLAQHNFPHGMVTFMDGLSKDPLRQKLNFLRTYQTDVQLVFRAAYGSAKDIFVYKEIGLQPQQIFIVGRASKRQHSQAQVLSDGYAAHLNDLVAPGGSRPAVGNARFFIRKSCFSLPTISEGKRSAKRSISCPHSSHSTMEFPFSSKHDGMAEQCTSFGSSSGKINASEEM